MQLTCAFVLCVFGGCALVRANNELKSPNNAYRWGKCFPADCSEDGDCYCSDRKEGWFDGGAGKGNNWETSWEPRCYKAGVGNCYCMDCGQIFFPDVQCQDLRCNDDTDYLVRRSDEPFAGGKQCYSLDPQKGKVYKDRQWYFNCYGAKKKCDHTRCGFGTKLSGCMRVSEGSCVSCGDLPEGKYWLYKGHCDMATCDGVEPGYYMTSPCGSTANTGKQHCSEYPGNPNAKVLPNPVAQYYCPGGALPPVRVPSFGKVTSDYTDFDCADGYSKHATECRACLPGFACKHNRAFQCKVNYYTDAYAQSSCKRCTSSCTYATEVPMRCQAGSIQNSHCVSCGLCGVYPATGVNCVRDIESFVKLPATCTPRNVESNALECEEG